MSHSRLHPLFSDAYKWLCLRRCKHPPSSDVWDLRRNWNKIKEVVIDDFAKGCYKLSVQKKITLSCGDTIAIWSSRDALENLSKDHKKSPSELGLNTTK